MIVADGKLLAEMEGEVSFLRAVARYGHHGSVLNSLHLITQTEIEDVNLVRQQHKR